MNGNSRKRKKSIGGGDTCVGFAQHGVKIATLLCKRREFILNRHKIKNVLFHFQMTSTIIIVSAEAEIQFKGEWIMNTDKIYAEAIANEYAPKDTSKVVALRKLDRKAKRKANIFAYTFGMIMALVLGTGMCISMNVIGDGSTFMMIVGIVIGMIGMIGVGVNYPIYKKLLDSGKQKYSFEIMQLAKEISEEAE